MPSLTADITQTIKIGGDVVSKLVSYTGTGRTTVEILAAELPDSTTDLEVNVNLDVSQIKALYMVSTQALTVETNSASVPDDTIVLVANTALVWWAGSYYTNLLATDVTAMFLTNASGSAAQFTLEVIHDATP